MQEEQNPEKAAREFERQAEESSPSLLNELWQFLRENKKWWLMPIVIVLLLFSAIALLTGTGAAPFIYPFH